MNIFITGMPGCGKSSLLKELIRILSKKGTVAGIISPEIRHNKKREGFIIKDIATKRHEILASTNIKPKVISKYGVNIKGIDKIVSTFLKSLPKAKYIIIDEIGKMELLAQSFKQMLDTVLNSNRIVIATLHRNLVKDYKSKGTILWLTRKNREQIKERIISMLK